jgi:hypothetical protein
VNKQLIVIVTLALGTLLSSAPSAYGADARDAMHSTATSQRTVATVWESPTRTNQNAGNVDWNPLLVNKIVDRPTQGLGAYSASLNPVGHILGYEVVTSKAEDCTGFGNCDRTNGSGFSMTLQIIVAASIAGLLLTLTVSNRVRRHKS